MGINFKCPVCQTRLTKDNTSVLAPFERETEYTLIKDYVCPECQSTIELTFELKSIRKVSNDKDHQV